MIFSDLSLHVTYRLISKENKEGLFRIILPPNSKIPPPNVNYPTTLFSEASQHVLVIILSLFGEDDTGIVNEQALGCLSLVLQPNIVLDIPSYLAKSIIFQF